MKQKHACRLSEQRDELDAGACRALDQLNPLVGRFLDLFVRHRIAYGTNILLIIKAGRRAGLEPFDSQAT